MRVFIVDNNPAERARTAEQLRLALPRLIIVEIAHQAALETALTDLPPDLVVTEHAEAWPHGLTVLQTVRARHPAVPVLIYTGAGSEELAVRSLKAGMYDYIPKRAPDLLRAALHELLAQGQPHARLGDAAIQPSAAKARLQQSITRQPDNDARLHTVLDQMLVMLNAVDAQGVFIYWNRECERVTGYTAAEIVGNPRAFELLYPDAAYRRWMHEEWARRGDFFYDCELELTARDGSTRVVAWSNISGYAPVQGWHSWAVGVDVTTRHQVEQERLLLERRMLEIQKFESLGLLAGGVAHDFNNLLTVMMGHASLISDELPRGSPWLISLQKIEHAARRASELTRQLLAYAGRSRFISGPIRIHEPIADMLALIATSVGHGIVIRTAFDSEVPWVEADTDQICQLVMNLVINAAEAMQGGPGTITIATAARWCEEHLLTRTRAVGKLAPGLYAILEVADTGCGIEASIIERIFDPFFTTKTGARGLGLATVFGIVRGHNGGVEVKSAPGQGTTFTILLPAHPT